MAGRNSSNECALVYLTYNSEKAVRANLPDLLRFSGRPFSICAIDNASTDDSAIALWQMGIGPLVNEENIGYTAAINQGIEWALHGNAEWILLINPDVKPISKPWLPELLAVPPECGIVGAKLNRVYMTVHAGGRVTEKSYPFQWYHSYQFGNKKLWCNESIGLSRTMHRTGFDNQYMSPEQVPWVTFAVVAIRRRVFEAIGLLNEKYWLYSSDIEFCMRALTSGWEVWYNPVEFEHEQGGSLRSAPHAIHERGQQDIRAWLEDELEWLKRAGLS